MNSEVYLINKYHSKYWWNALVVPGMILTDTRLPSGGRSHVPTPRPSITYKGRRHCSPLIGVKI